MCGYPYKIAEYLNWTLKIGCWILDIDLLPPLGGFLMPPVMLEEPLLGGPALNHDLNWIKIKSKNYVQVISISFLRVRVTKQAVVIAGVQFIRANIPGEVASAPGGNPLPGILFEADPSTE